MWRFETGILVRLVRCEDQTSPKFSGSNGEEEKQTSPLFLGSFGEVW
jgi:hypothetical protein